MILEWKDRYLIVARSSKSLPQEFFLLHLFLASSFPEPIAAELDPRSRKEQQSCSSSGSIGWARVREIERNMVAGTVQTHCAILGQEVRKQIQSR